MEQTPEEQRFLLEFQPVCCYIDSREPTVPPGVHVNIHAEQPPACWTLLGLKLMTHVFSAHIQTCKLKNKRLCDQHQERKSTFSPLNPLERRERPAVHSPAIPFSFLLLDKNKRGRVASRWDVKNITLCPWNTLSNNLQILVIKMKLHTPDILIYRSPLHIDGFLQFVFLRYRLPSG